MFLETYLSFVGMDTSLPIPLFSIFSLCDAQMFDDTRRVQQHK